MPTKPFITIGIASYNYSNFLEKAFNAIKTQSFTDYEILYYDDYSNDNSVEIIEKFILENSQINIRLIKGSENKGLLYSKTQLIENARGKYLMLCDADDYMLPECLAKLAAVAKDSDADRVISQVQDITLNGRLIQIQDFDSNASPWLWNIHHGCLYKTSILQKNNISIDFYPDDVYLITRFNEYAEQTLWINEPLYCWVVHHDSTSRKKIANRKKIVDEFQTCVNFINNSIKTMSKKGKDVSDILEVLILKIYYLYLYHNSRYYSLNEKISLHKELKKIIILSHPNYLKNKLLLSQKKCGLRKYAYYILKGSVIIERLRLMPLSLFAYHIIGKFHYFDM